MGLLCVIWRRAGRGGAGCPGLYALRKLGHLADPVSWSLLCKKQEERGQPGVVPGNGREVTCVGWRKRCSFIWGSRNTPVFIMQRPWLRPVLFVFHRNRQVSASSLQASRRTLFLSLYPAAGTNCWRTQAPPDPRTICIHIGQSVYSKLFPGNGLS